MSALTDQWIPRGLLSEAHLTVTNAGTTSTSLTNLTGTVSTNNATGAAGNLAVTTGVQVGRRYRILVDLNLTSNVAGDDVGVSAAVSGAAGTLVGQLSGTSGLAIPTTRFYNVTPSGLYYPTATGSLTVTVQYLRRNGTGTITAGAGSSIVIEDVGLAP